MYYTFSVGKKAPHIVKADLWHYYDITSRHKNFPTHFDNRYPILYREITGNSIHQCGSVAEIEEDEDMEENSV